MAERIYQYLAARMPRQLAIGVMAAGGVLGIAAVLALFIALMMLTNGWIMAVFTVVGIGGTIFVIAYQWLSDSLPERKHKGSDEYDPYQRMVDDFHESEKEFKARQEHIRSGKV